MIALEQGRYRREDNGPPLLVERSPGFQDEWLAAAERLVLGFGIRPAGQACPPAVFALPLVENHVAVVQVADQPGAAPALGFHFLVLERLDYAFLAGDPFALARQFPPRWREPGPLATLMVPRVPPAPRRVDQVQRVLQRVKASALKEDENPEDPAFERTPENSESPALLGGVQVLVDDGKLVFQRPGPDPDLIEGLWTLLPQSTRAKLWPASFAFGNALGFDALVVPRVHVADYEGYTSEEQAAEYPAGHYELALQIAAETGNQRELDGLLQRRSGSETLRLGWMLLVLLIFLVLAPRLLDLLQPAPKPVDFEHQAAAAAGMVGVGDPWTALGLRLHAHHLWGPKTGGKRE